LQQHNLVRLRIRLMDEPSLDDRSEVHLERPIVEVTCDIRLGLQFRVLGCMHGTYHRAIDNDMRDPDLSFDASVLGEHQGSRLTFRRDYLAAHVAIDAQSPAEADITFDRGTGADQTFDAVLWLM